MGLPSDQGCCLRAKIIDEVLDAKQAEPRTARE